MQFPTRLKLVLVSVLSVLIILLGMFASTSPASAQSLRTKQVNPRITIITAFQFGSQCVGLRINGRNFIPSTRNRSSFAKLVVFGLRRNGGRAFSSLFARFVLINRNGRFTTRQATVCGRFFRIANVCAQAQDQRSGRFSNVACVRFSNRRPFGSM